MVARSRLRATKLNIIAATKRASNNRKRLEKCVYNYWKDKATSTLQASLNPSADGDAPSSRNNAQSFDGDYSFRWGSRMPSRNRYNHSRSRMDPEAAAGISTGNDYMQGILDRSGYFGGVGRNRSRGTPDLYDPGLGLGLNMGFGLDDDDDDFDIAAALNLIEAQHMNQSHRNEIGSDNNASVPDRMSEAEVVGDSAGIAEHSMSESVADTVNTPPPVPRTGLIPHHNPRTAQHTPGISNLPPIPANIRNNMDPPTPPTSRSGGPERSDDTSNITPISATTTPTVRERRNRSDSNRLNMRMRQISLRLEEEEGLNRAIMMSFHDAVPSGESTGSILSPTPPSSDHVELLVAMGFNRQIAVEALRDANNNIEIATDRLLGST